MKARTLAAVAAACALAATSCGSGSSGAKVRSTGSPSASPSASPTTYTSPPATLPLTQVALSTQPPPWLPPAVVNGGKNSASYIAAAGLPYSEEMLSVHYHAHLDVIVDGQPVVVPPYIGFVVTGSHVNGLAPLHTHQNDGIIHIENSVPATFVLGQFFVEWGVRLTKSCIGGLCTGKGNELAFFVDGQRYQGDPTRIVLRKHEEIAIEYGAKGQLPTPPSSYTFPSGL